VLLFGPAAIAAGKSAVALRVADHPTSAAVASALADSVPSLAEFVRKGRLAVNHRFARPEEPIRSGDEVALIAMVSGG